MRPAGNAAKPPRRSGPLTAARTGSTCPERKDTTARVPWSRAGSRIPELHAAAFEGNPPVRSIRGRSNATFAYSVGPAAIPRPCPSRAGDGEYARSSTTPLAGAFPEAHQERAYAIGYIVRCPRPTGLPNVLLPVRPPESLNDATMSMTGVRPVLLCIRQSVLHSCRWSRKQRTRTDAATVTSPCDFVCHSL
jgi:hypothetical protein